MVVFRCDANKKKRETSLLQTEGDEVQMVSPFANSDIAKSHCGACRDCAFTHSMAWGKSTVARRGGRDRFWLMVLLPIAVAHASDVSASGCVASGHGVEASASNAHFESLVSVGAMADRRPAGLPFREGCVGALCSGVPGMPEVPPIRPLLSFDEIAILIDLMICGEGWRVEVAVVSDGALAIDRAGAVFHPPRG